MAAKWYIVHAYSNFEKKVSDAIMHAAKDKGLDQFIEEIKTIGPYLNFFINKNALTEHKQDK